MRIISNVLFWGGLVDLVLMSCAISIVNLYGKKYGISVEVKPISLAYCGLLFVAAAVAHTLGY